MNATELVHTRDLEQRLAEAEATIQALLSGQIDAVVDARSNTPVLLSKAQDALRESEERYRQIVEATTDGIIKIDGNERIVFVNRRFAEMLGYEPSEMMGMSVFDLMSAEEKVTAVDALENRRRGVKNVVDTVFLHKDETGISVNVAASPLFDTEGRRSGNLWVVRDFTEQRKLEEQLRQSQKMDAVGQLAGGMAHDFNNLLTVINGYSDLTIGRLQAEDPLRDDMMQIKQAGLRAAALTRQLLAFSRKQVLLPTVLDLNALILELEKMLRRLIGEDIALRADLSLKIGNIKADRGQIEQIVMNLVVNARDAMPSGGKLTIETQAVDLTEDYTSHHVDVNPGPYVMLAVTDTGVGMDAKTQARIFEPFFTTKEVGKGTGLGLSTVYGIVQQSGGTIAVYSEVGHGSTFKIYLPRVGDAPSRYPSGTSTVVVKGTETILLTEDDDMVRALASRVLVAYGYRVLEAANGAAAILICERHPDPIHLLITDIVMPGMHGRDLANQLEKVRPGLKILYMSGYTDRAIVHQQVLDEEMPFIQKPFAPQAFVNKVREVLDRPS